MHHPDDQITGAEVAAVRGLPDLAERFAAQDQPVAAGRGPTVVSCGDLAVGAADAQRQALDEKFLFARDGVGKLVDPSCARGPDSAVARLT